mgnify:CR=1 FL=1
MSERSVKIIYIVTAITLFALMLVGTFYDFRISEILSAADGKEYICDNAFARFFEVVGSGPLYLTTGFGVAFIAVKITEFKKSVLSALLFALCVAACIFAYTMLFKESSKYIAEHSGELESYNGGKGAVWGMSLITGAVCAAVSIIIAFVLPKSTRSGLFVFGLTAVIAFAISQGITQGIKPLFGRQRYRAIKFFEYRNLGQYVDYTPWYILRGIKEIPEDLVALGVGRDWYKSFPSGHSCSAAMSLCIIGLADMLNLRGKSYKPVKIVTSLIGVAITVTVAYSRILMGAHYLTDVTFGVGITIISIIISEKIVKTLVKKIKI